MSEDNKRCMNKTVETNSEKEERIIRITVDRDTYESGLLMINSAIQLAHIHGMWNNDKAFEIFGETGWLPPYDQLEIAPPRKKDE